MLHRPEHGQVRALFTRQIDNGTTRIFYAKNGEGRCTVPRYELIPIEERFCAGCGEWIRIEGVLAFFQNDFVGCENCGREFPAGSRRT